MPESIHYVIGTSGYSFADWVGAFYPPGTRRDQMLAHYVQHFDTVELNFTYYRMPTARTLQKLAEASPEGFQFWVKANQQVTHKYDLSVAEEFLENLRPLTGTGKLAGILLQFPQSFHRTVENRKYLAAAVETFAATPLAVEFRHFSWSHAATFAGLRDRGVTLVVPDVPNIGGLFRCPAAATTATGYLRLHSRNAENWYAGAVERYDYNYSDGELRALIEQWSQLEQEVDRVFAFFNNCHRGQAAENAEAFRRILAELG